MDCMWIFVCTLWIVVDCVDSCGLYDVFVDCIVD